MTSSTVTFRAVTPLYNFTLWTKDGDSSHRGGSFSESGTFRGVDYEIKILQTHRSDLPGVVFDVTAPEIVRELCLPAFCTSFDGYYMLVETTVPKTEDLMTTSNTLELLLLHSAFLNAMHIHTEGGLGVSKVFWLKNVLNPYGFNVSTGNLCAGWPNPFFVGPGTLSDSETPFLMDSFKLFLEESWKNSQFGRILDLTMDSMRLHGASGRAEHAFLILMVAFEALFKDEEENSDRAARRLTELLCQSSKSEKQSIQQKFIAKGTGFRDLRNCIAHGDSHTGDAAESLRSLRGLIQRALVVLLHHYDLSPPSDGDFYSWVEGRAKGNFLALPARPGSST